MTSDVGQWLSALDRIGGSMSPRSCLGTGQ